MLSFLAKSCFVSFGPDSLDSDSEELSSELSSELLEQLLSDSSLEVMEAVTDRRELGLFFFLRAFWALRGRELLLATTPLKSLLLL